MQTSSGLWMPSAGAVVAIYCATAVFLFLVGAWLYDLNRNGEDLASQNRVELASLFSWFAGVSYASYKAVRAAERRVFNQDDDQT